MPSEKEPSGETPDKLGSPQEGGPLSRRLEQMKRSGRDAMAQKSQMVPAPHEQETQPEPQIEEREAEYTLLGTRGRKIVIKKDWFTEERCRMTCTALVGDEKSHKFMMLESSDKVKGWFSGLLEVQPATIDFLARELASFDQYEVAYFLDNLTTIDLLIKKGTISTALCYVIKSEAAKARGTQEDEPTVISMNPPEGGTTIAIPMDNKPTAQSGGKPTLPPNEEKVGT